jgi:hypothetical protein
VKAIENFFFRPASPKPLGVLRMGLALILLIQAFMCSNQLFEWYGTQGLLQRGVAESFAAFSIPQTTQFIRWGADIGIGERTTLITMALLYLASLLALLVGFYTRTASLLSWMFHLIFAQGHITSYGLDLLAHVALFYSVFMPMGDCLSTDSMRKKIPAEDSWQARLSLRIFQLHLCIVYFSTGIEKAQGEQWRNGEAIWRSVMLPSYRQFDLAWLSRFSILAMILAWATLVFEIGYPFFIFPKKTRKFWVTGILGLHAGIAVFLGLHLFALLMMLLTFCCFGLDKDSPVKPITVRRGKVAFV